MSVAKFINFGEKILTRLEGTEWWPGARYTNLRTVKRFDRIGFLDIDWKEYCFETHVMAVKAKRPILTVARDVTDSRLIDQVIEEVVELNQYSDYVIVVPKAADLQPSFWDAFPFQVIQGYSVPTKYGNTVLSNEFFDGPVHLLGGSALAQRRLAGGLNVVSLDNNNITIDAKYGKYFDGSRSVKFNGGSGNHDNCIFASLDSITKVWSDYTSDFSGISEDIRGACEREIVLNKE